MLSASYAGMASSMAVMGACWHHRHSLEINRFGAPDNSSCHFSAITRPSWRSWRRPRHRAGHEGRLEDDAMIPRRSLAGTSLLTAITLLGTVAYVFAFSCGGGPCPRCWCPNYSRRNCEARAEASRCCRTGAGTPWWVPRSCRSSRGDLIPTVRYMGFASVAALSGLFTKFGVEETLQVRRVNGEAPTSASASSRCPATLRWRRRSRLRRDQLVGARVPRYEPAAPPASRMMKPARRPCPAR